MATSTPSPEPTPWIQNVPDVYTAQVNIIPAVSIIRISWAAGFSPGKTWLVASEALGHENACRACADGELAVTAWFRYFADITSNKLLSKIKSALSRITDAGPDPFCGGV
jgi:hypothetical protein